MNRWLFSIASLLVLGSVTLFGCSEPKDASASTGGTGSASTSESTGSTTTGGTSEPTKEAETPKETPPADKPLAEKPSDGDDVAVLDTTMGKIVIMFYPSKAPLHVENFMNLAKSGFYDGTRFHRCIPGFMIQGGDPLSKDKSTAARWGSGGNMGKDGKEINVRAEFNDIHHAPGIVSMARSTNPDSASSQFFIMVDDNSSLDHNYSAFGKVVSGLDIAQKIVTTGDAGDNGRVDPEKAVVLKSVKISKWPLK